MAMPKGTKPKIGNWIECDIAAFKTAVNSMHRALITTMPYSPDQAKETTYRSPTGIILARHRVYKKGEQCLIHQTMREHVPAARHVNDSVSIYEGGSL